MNDAKKVAVIGTGVLGAKIVGMLFIFYLVNSYFYDQDILNIIFIQSSKFIDIVDLKNELLAPFIFENFIHFCSDVTLQSISSFTKIEY